MSSRAPLPGFLYVDARPTRLGDTLFRRRDVRPVLLRFPRLLGHRPPDYLERTAHLPSFDVDTALPLRSQAARFRAFARERGLDVRYFCNPSEPLQEPAHHFARLLSLPALTRVQAGWLRDKLRMKKRLRGAGFRVAEHAPVREAGDVAAFALRHGWPVVVKRTDGYACVDTARLDDPAALAGLSLSPGRSWMVEAFVEGREYGCCALVRNGRVLGTYLSYLPASPLDASNGAINANISVPRPPADFPVNTGRLVQGIVDAMQIAEGYFHMEFFLAPDGACTVGEVALRLAGCELPADHSLANGFDIYDALIDIHAGMAPRLHYTRSRCVGDLLLPYRPGLVTHVTPLAELLDCEGVIGGEVSVTRGDILPHHHGSHLCTGFVHVEGDSAPQVEARMRAVLERYQLGVAAA